MKKIRVLFLAIIFVVGCFGTVFSESPPTTDSLWKPDTFERKIGGKFSSAVLEITLATNDSFNFKIKAHNGANTGSVSGIAYTDNNTAVFNDGKGGTLDFIIRGSVIQIKQSQKMYKYGGMGVGFEGEYTNKEFTKTPVENEHYFTDQKVFKGNQEQEFRRIVGDNYVKFINTGHMFYSEEDLDNLGVRVHRMGVRGLFTIMESIIMVRDSDNSIWAAVIDGDKVLYFTNTKDTQQVPITISRWHDRLKNKPIYYIPAK